MKKIVSVVICLAVWLLFPAAVRAAGAGASLSGPDTVRAGDTVTLTFCLGGSGIRGVSGALSYDSSQVTLSRTGQVVGGSWTADFNGDTFLVYDNDLTSPIDGSENLFTVTFQVRSSLSGGTPIRISCVDVTASDGASDIYFGTVDYCVTLDEPVPPNATASTPVPEHEAAPTGPETLPTQTDPAMTGPSNSAPQEGDRFYHLLLIAACFICLCVGVCAGSAIVQRSGKRDP